MKKDSIRIAAWNLLGPGNGEKSKATAEKINDFQRIFVGKNEENPIDIALFLESREGTGRRLPTIDDSCWKTGIKVPSEKECKSNPAGAFADSTLIKGPSEKECKSSVWVSARENNRNYPKGILLVNYSQELEINLFCNEDGKIIRPDSSVDNATNCRTAIGFSVRLKSKPDHEVLRVLCIWTTPEPDEATGKVSTLQETYFTVLSNILQYYKKNRFFVSEVPCIVLGDTNVNLSSGADNQSRIETENCKIKLDGQELDTASCIKRLADDCELSEPLNLSYDPHYSSPPLNTLEHCGLWYRCDLMMISKAAIEEEKKLKSAYLGNFEQEKSDHCPIIFEISVTD